MKRYARLLSRAPPRSSASTRGVDESVAKFNRQDARRRGGVMLVCANSEFLLTKFFRRNVIFVNGVYFLSMRFCFLLDTPHRDEWV